MGKKLLLADDSITIQKVVGIIFANEDYALTVVDNGNAALDKAREILPDIILVDVLMPGMNGYEVCAEIRRDPALKHVPLLLLTGAFEPFDEEKARQSGADDFISKPFESQQLIEKVRTLIELGQGRVTAKPAQGPAAVAAPPVPPPPLPVPPAAPVAVAPAEELFQLEDVSDDAAMPVTDIYVAEGTVEAAPEDDLWGAFELEEVPAGEAVEFEAVLEDEFTAAADEFEVVEEFSFAEEGAPAPTEAGPATIAPPVAESGAWAQVDEQIFAMEEEGAGSELAAVPEEEPYDFALEEEPAAAEPAAGMVFEEVASLQEPPPLAADFAVVAPPATAQAPEVELEFAPEAEYVPVAADVAPAEPAAPIAPIAPIAPVAPAPQVAPAAAVAPQPAPAGEATLSETQLAAIVSRISRDIIEKIAWEVVPDLAETLIREEIRKIKEGR
jgi:CheY-like chemotaxis protein